MEKQKEITAMEKHPNYQRHLDELAKLSPKERQEMEDHCKKYMMDDEAETMQPSDPEKPNRTSWLTKLAIIRAAKKKVKEQKQKELQQEKPKQDLGSSSINI